MKSVSKKIIVFLPAIITSLIISFSIYIYEPITMYANNIDDFWFDLYTLMNSSLVFFLATFIILLFFFIVIKLLSKLIKHPNLYYIILSLSSACYICAYIHSNFLTGFLPPLDGTTFDWSNLAANTTSVIICCFLLFLCIIGFIKIKPQKTAKYGLYILSTIFIMLLVSLSSTFLTTKVFEPKEILATSTVKNLNTISSDENFLILLLDAIDSTHFNKIIKNNPKYQQDLKDFTYFPDTLSGYSFTRDSIPFIFSGKWNENQTSFPEYSKDAFDSSELFDQLSSENFNKNFYDNDFVWGSTKALEFDNISSIEKNPKQTILFKEETRYYLYKALPFPLKKYSKIENLDFASAQTVQEDEPFDWSNIKYYDSLKQPLSKIDQKYFHYVHIEGAHVPFNLNKDVTLISEDVGTYEDKLEASMTIIEAYLNRLKENNVYDNSSIVILADHGFWHNGTSRANPILYIKGKSETHDKMPISNKQISFVDLHEAFIELLKHKDSTEIFDNIPTEGRTRRFIHNSFNHEEHMEEFEQTDKAWNTKTLKPTGREFIL